jgi:hypothetical protein
MRREKALETSEKDRNMFTKSRYHFLSCLPNSTVHPLPTAFWPRQFHDMYKELVISFTHGMLLSLTLMTSIIATGRGPHGNQSENCFAYIGRPLYRVGQTQLGSSWSLTTNQSNNTGENGKVPFVSIVPSIDICHFPLCCWIDWLLMIKSCLIESGPTCS